MHRPIRAALVATLLATAAMPRAQAADITADQAKALESQISSWMRGLAGLNTNETSRPVQVSPEGDHYRLALPIGKPDPITLTASIRPTEGGRWAIEGPRIPSPAHFTLQMPPPSPKGQTTPDAAIPVDYTVTIGSQDNQATFDPGYTTPTTLTTSFRNLKVEAKRALTDQLTTVVRSASTNTLRPSGADRVDLIIDSTTEGYRLRAMAGPSSPGDSQPVEAAAQRVRVTGEITSVSRDRMAQIVPALVRITGGVVAGMPKAGSKAPAASPSIDPELLRTILQSLQDLASEFTLDETADGIAVHYGPYAGTATQARIGMGAKSDGGLLQAHMDLGLDGLALPDLTLGAMADLLPRKIALRPVLSGVATQDLIRLLVAVSNSKDGDPPAEFAALFSRGGVSAGLESFTLDIADTSFAGMGKMMVASPQNLTGLAQVTATNFDDLMQRANRIPELAGALPVFVFAKGIGRIVDNRVVWDITYRGGRLLVNGTDLSSMMGSGNR